MEKGDTVIEVQAVPTPRATQFEEDQRRLMLHLPEDDLAPGFWTRFPWGGLGALIVVLCCCVGSVIVLVASHNVSQNQWPERIAPNVVLAAMNGLANICFGFAIANGIAIAWWRQTQNGATVEELQRSYSFSVSLREIVFSWRHFNVIALATLAAKMTIIDGTLMQEASYTVTEMDPPVNITVTGYANQSFPFTGFSNGISIPSTSLTPGLNKDLRLWSQSGGVLPSRFSGCEGVCLVNIPAGGFEFDCTEATVVDTNYDKFGYASNNTFDSAPLFNLSFSLEGANLQPSDFEDPFGHYQSSYISMDLLYVQLANGPEVENAATCPGVHVKQSCKLLPALVNYPVQIMNYTDEHARNGLIVGSNVANFTGSGANATNGLYDAAAKQQTGYEVLHLLNVSETVYSRQIVQSHLSGLLEAFNMYLAGNSLMVWDGVGGYRAQQIGNSPQYLGSAPSEEQCSYWYTSPMVGDPSTNTPSVLAKINEIMFSLVTDLSQDSAATTADLQTTFQAQRYSESIHYHSNYWYMLGAIASTVICVILTACSYWGFWELGRKVSLGPFEIAQVFRSSVFHEEAGVSASHAGTLVDESQQDGVYRPAKAHIVHIAPKHSSWS